MLIKEYEGLNAQKCKGRKKKKKKKTKQPSLLASSNIQVLWIFEVSFSLCYMELNIGLVGIHNRLNIRQSLYTYVRTM